MKKLGIGLYGTHGHQLFSCFSGLKQCCPAAVAGMAMDTFEKLKEKTPGVFDDTVFCEDLDNMLERKDVDMISFCSPRRDRQAAECVLAMRAGKHVLAEKPAATNRDDFDKLVSVTKETGMQFRLMTNMIYHPAVLKMKEITDSGVLGEIVQVYAMKSYPYHDNRPQDEGIDGGLIMQALIHAVSVVRFITGGEFSEMFAQETGRGNPAGGELKMAANCAARMENGMLVSLVGNYLNPAGIGFHGNDQIRIFGRKGMMECVDGFTRTRIAVENKLFEDIKIPDVPSAYPQDYIDELLGGPPAMMSTEDAFRNTSVVLAAKESSASGRSVSSLFAKCSTKRLKQFNL